LEHECPNVSVTCKDCGDIIRRGDIQNHTQDACIKSLLDQCGTYDMLIDLKKERPARGQGLVVGGQI